MDGISLEKVSLRIPLYKGTTINLDPHTMDDAYSMAVNLQVYRGLFRYTPSGEITPDLASSWIIEDEGRRIRIKLNEAEFSNGKKITTENVVNSFARVFSLPSNIASDLDYISGSKELHKTKVLRNFGVRAISKNEIEFILERPSAIFFHQLAAVDCAILPLKSNDETLIFNNSKFGFSGPYKVQSITSDTIVIEKWRKDALDSQNPPGRIEYFITKRKPEDIVASDKPDTLDHISIPETLVENLLKNGWVKSLSNIVRENFIVLNPKVYDVDTRRSLVSLVNQKDLVNSLGKQHIQPAFSLIPHGVNGTLSEVQYKKVKPMTPSSHSQGNIRIQFYKDNALLQKCANYLSKVWGQAGFKVEVKALELNELFDLLFNAKGDVLLGTKLLDYYDGFSVLGYFRSDYSSNYFHVHDRQIDSELDLSLSMLDDDKRMIQYQRIQERVLSHFTVVPLFFGTDSSGLWSSKVKSVPAHPMGIHMLPIQTLTM